MQLVLDVDPAADPLSGRVERDDGREWTFTTWVGLLSVLRTALEQEHDQVVSTRAAKN